MSSAPISLIGDDGSGPSEIEGLRKEDLKRLYELMLLVRLVDSHAMSLQRQGRITFYVPCQGEEAAEVGSAYALEPEDWAFTDYRGSGIVLTRGLSLKAFFAQLMGKCEDILKGRNMPSHWGSRGINIVSPSSNVCTQLPHAVGVALGAKLRGHRIATIAYFGDGGTSSNDFHAALNFAGVFKAPTVFFCRNNGYAISVPVAQQTASSTLAIKASAYGIEGVRIDGNDVLAVYKATKEALARAKEGKGPTLIEAVTYRLGPHTSIDDPRRYRDDEEVRSWEAKEPLKRFRLYLEHLGLWSPEEEVRAKEDLMERIREAVAEVEALEPPSLMSLVEDVYSEIPWNLREELEELEEGGPATG